MTYSILHLSDLHRSPDDPISNDELISALVSDRERYTAEDPKVRAPDFVVVSGDIIQGVPLGTPDFSTRLAEQYQTADAFLSELTDRFLAGDRSKIVLIPGNHDVDWNTALTAMIPVASADEPKNLAGMLFREDSKYRWSWREKKLYKIVDDELYANRLSSFWEFFGKFYQNVPSLLRVAPNALVNLYSSFGGRAAIAAFNSCEGNDCFSFHGSIKKEAIARTHLDLSGPGQNYDLRIAVWHHSVDGSPHKSDYMDRDVVRGMIGRGFRLGLYGHQHRAQAVAHEIYLPGRERMAVVSAGSLCAGRSELPTGTHRQYNVIELSDDLQSAKVHVRAMVVANLFARDYLWDFGGRSFAEINWEPPTNDVGLITDVSKQNTQRAIEKAEAAFKAGNFSLATDNLLKIPRPSGSYQKELLVSVALAAEDWALLLIETDPPATIDELAKRTEAFCHTKEFRKAKEVLVQYSEALELPASLKSELEKRISAIEAMKK